MNMGITWVLDGGIVLNLSNPRNICLQTAIVRSWVLLTVHATFSLAENILTDTVP